MHIARVLVTACTVLFTVLFTVTAKKYNLIVGNNGQPAFDPTHIEGLKAGDQLVFYYDPASKSPHVIFQSSFENPCSRKTGGYGPINSTGNTYRINNGDAVYFYSSTDDECAAGMKLAINSPKYGSFLAATVVSNSSSNLKPTPIPSAINSTSAGFDLKMSIQKMTGLAGVALLVGSLT